MFFREKLFEHLSHVHPHPHLPHTQDYSQMFNPSSNGSSSPSSGGALSMLGASMAAHPVGWAIGAVVVVGAIAYFALKED